MAGVTEAVDSEITDEKRKQNTILMRRQCTAIIENKSVPCSCGSSVPVIHMFRCYFCGVWFCRCCAGDHFGSEGNQSEYRRIHMEGCSDEPQQPPRAAGEK